MSTIPSVPSSTNSTSNSTPTFAPKQTLGQDDFLKLLVKQMTSQDPLNPQSDTAFVAQLAQFSSLQQAQTMQGNMAGLQANSLLGRTVIVNNPDGSQASGLVSGVQIQAGTPEIVVNGQGYALSQLTAILPAATTTP